MNLHLLAVMVECHSLNNNLHLLTAMVECQFEH